MDKIMFAMETAKIAHKNQTRKYTNEPYIVHPFAVAGLVSAVTSDEDMICAALLHDVVEDTPMTLTTIHGIFGSKVSQLVSDLTDVSNQFDGNRKARKKIDLEHTAQASPSSKTIKSADLIDNTKSIIAFDNKFSKVYMAEKRLLLRVLADGDSTLFRIANNLVTEYYKDEK